MPTKQKTYAPAKQEQKEKFISDFAEIVKENPNFNIIYKVQFFESPHKTNYAFVTQNQKSINVLEMLSPDELNEYKMLKSTWQE